MALSKDWTLANLRGLLRSVLNEIGEDNLQTLVLDDIIHVGVLGIADLLAIADYPEYGETAEPSTATNGTTYLDVSALRISKIEKLVDAINGKVLPSTKMDFDNIINIPQKQGNVYYYWFGQKLLLYKAAALTYGAFTLYYLRIPEKATADGDYIDVSDRFIGLLIDQTKFMLYETLKQKVPDGLSAGIEKKVADILKNRPGASG